MLWLELNCAAVGQLCIACLSVVWAILFVIVVVWDPF